MSNEQAATEAGTNASTEVTATEATAEVGTETSIQETPTDSGSEKGVKKLLSQRNEARSEAEKLAQENEELRRLVEQSVKHEIDTTKRKEELSNFKANVDEEIGKNVEEFVNQNP